MRVKEKLTLLRADGTTEDIPPPSTLEKLQTGVGGYIECLTSPNKRTKLFVNEEGRLQKLPVNAQASAVLRGWYPDRRVMDLLGDVVLVER